MDTNGYESRARRGKPPWFRLSGPAACVVAISLGGALAAYFVYRVREPSWEGRPLRHWLVALDGLNPAHAQRRAEQAVRSIGTNGLATLVQWIRAQDSPLKTKIVELVGRQQVLKFKFVHAY